MNLKTLKDVTKDALPSLHEASLDLVKQDQSIHNKMGEKTKPG